MASRRLIAILALCASFFALCVITLGAFTRLMDAGLGCPDWPGCYGHITAPLSTAAAQTVQMQYPGSHLEVYKAWAEMVHRYFAGTLSLLILAIVVTIFAKKAARVRSNIIFASMLLLLIAYQIMLGQWTVTLKLLPIIVTQHLLGGFLILITLWLVHLNNKNNHATFHPHARKIYPWAVLGLVLLFLQIFLGAWTSTNYASLSCADFPFCSNDQPAMTLYLKEAFNLFAPVGVNYEGGVLSTAVRQTIQMVHRCGALIVTTYLFFLLGYALNTLRSTPALLKPLYLLIGLLCVQLSLGISNVIFKLPLAVAIAHNVTAALLLVTMVTFVFKLRCSDDS